MRSSPTWRLVSLKVPEASTATYASSPLPTAVMAGKAAQTSRELPAKISFLRPVAVTARATRSSSKALTHDRPQSRAGGLYGGFESRRPFLLPVAGELDDEDGVLTRQADQHHKAHLGENVVVHAAKRDACDGAQHAHRHDQDHRQRQRPAL